MQLEGLDELYQDVVLDHYRSPRNRKLLEGADLKAEGFNPFCGDRVVLTAVVDESGEIANVGFQGQGCAISQASASMMTEAIKGLTIEQAKALLNRFKAMMQGKLLEAYEKDGLKELIILEGVKKFPIRIKCALLAWSTLQDGISEYHRQHT